MSIARSRIALAALWALLLGSAIGVVSEQARGAQPVHSAAGH